MSMSLEKIPEGNEDAESSPNSPPPDETEAAQIEEEIMEACPFALSSSIESGYEIIIPKLSTSSEECEILQRSWLTTTTRESFSSLEASSHSSNLSFSPRQYALSIFDNTGITASPFYMSQMAAEREESSALAQTSATGLDHSIWGDIVISETNSDAECDDDPFFDVRWYQIDLDWVKNELIPYFQQGKHLSCFFAENVSLRVVS